MQLPITQIITSADMVEVIGQNQPIRHVHIRVDWRLILIKDGYKITATPQLVAVKGKLQLEDGSVYHVNDGEFYSLPGVWNESSGIDFYINKLQIIQNRCIIVI